MGKNSRNSSDDDRGVCCWCCPRKKKLNKVHVQNGDRNAGTGGGAEIEMDSEHSVNHKPLILSIIQEENNEESSLNKSEFLNLVNHEETQN